MAMRLSDFNRLFKLICIITFVQNLMYGFEETPKLELGFKAGENMVNWSGNALMQIEQSHQKAKSGLEQVSRFVQYLESLSVPEIEKNRAHFDHLQKLKNCEFEALYWFGVYKLELSEWGPKEIQHHLDKLKARNSTPEFELAFLKALKAWPEFYKKNRQVLELYEAFPEKLKLKPPIPPEFYEVATLPVNSLHDLTVIIDIALKHHWNPEPKNFEALLMRISSVFENKKAYHFAYETLQLMDPSKRSDKFSALITDLKDKSKNPPKPTSSKSLY